MILDAVNSRIDLLDYGIQIPLSADRPARIIKELLRDPFLAAHRDRWYHPEELPPLAKEDILRVHTPEYGEALFSQGLKEKVMAAYELVDEQGQLRRYDPALARKPWEDLAERLLIRGAGCARACQRALEEGFAFFLGGGTHHAHAAFGHGFCLFNDVLTAARKAQAEEGVTTVWIIDVDVHKGDGTAAITRHDDSIITFSIHSARGWPVDGDEYTPQGSLNPSFIPSDIDIPLEKGQDHLYLPRLQEGLNALAAYPAPDLAIVVSGADPYEHDELPSSAGIALSLEQMIQRDRLVYNFLASRAIPRAYLMAGGYGPRAWEPYPPFLAEVLKG